MKNSNGEKRKGDQVGTKEYLAAALGNAEVTEKQVRGNHQSRNLR